MTARAAMILPQNVEKLPLFHWRPGARLLAVGSRDGADFGGDRTTDRTTYQRVVTPELLRAASAKTAVDGIALTWNASLSEPEGVAAVLAATPATLVVVTPGVGDPDVLEALLPRVDAWVVLVTAETTPLTQRILAAGRHVEALIGLVDVSVPDLDWSRLAAVHLCARRPAEVDRLDEWLSTARAAIPSDLSVYDLHATHTRCRGCQEPVIWRHGGRSRVDALIEPTGQLRCHACGTLAPVAMR